MSQQQQPDREQDGRKPHPVTLRGFESMIDQQMREAEAAGLFKDLPGAGKPLDLSGDQDVPAELRAAFRALKGAGYAPPWIELQKQIRDELAALEAWVARAQARWPDLGPSDRAALRAEHEQKLRDLNKQISAYNLTAPAAAGQFPLLQPWRELRKLGPAE